MQLLFYVNNLHNVTTNGYKNGWKNDVQGREKAYALYNWNRLPVWLMDAAERLKKVQIENMPALDIIKRFRYSNVLIYADPPYLLNTRAAKQYKYEMNEQDHIDLLEVLIEHPGPVLLSGYQSSLYDELLKGWTKSAISSNAEGGLSRTEVMWMNFEPVRQLSIL